MDRAIVQENHLLILNCAFYLLYDISQEFERVAAQLSNLIFLRAIFRRRWISVCSFFRLENELAVHLDFLQPGFKANELIEDGFCSLVEMVTLPFTRHLASSLSLVPLGTSGSISLKL